MDSAAPHTLALVQRMWADIGGDPVRLQRTRTSVAELPPVPLVSRSGSSAVAAASITALMLATDRDPASLDPHRIAAAYRSDRYLSVGGVAPLVWSPYSGFWRCADGWVRTHGNYPHHASALIRALGLSPDADAAAVSRALASSSSLEAAARITGAGGLAVVVSPEDPGLDERLRGTPLVEVRRTGPAPRRVRPDLHGDHPLQGVRVLDLTRVIAGPVCTRTLALLGADVLRIDPPHVPELPWQHLDTGHGKATALLDARTSTMRSLIRSADVVVLGYRPSALARIGLTPEALNDGHPGLVVAQLSAWGLAHPERAGFDSLVQAESGIALLEATDDTPGALPAQVLDHSSGYLLAAAIVTALERQTAEGGSWLIRTSLRRMAAELLGMPRAPKDPAPATYDPTPHLAHFDVDGLEVITTAPVIPGTAFRAPHVWASDEPRWAG